MDPLVIPLVAKRVVDFTTLAGPPSGVFGSVVLADRINIVRWRSLSLRVQVHSHTISLGSNETISVAALAQSISTEDPSISFVDNNAAVGGVTIRGTPPVCPSPGFLEVNLNMLGFDCAGPMIRIIANGQRPLSSATPLIATISVDLVAYRD